MKTDALGIDIAARSFAAALHLENGGGGQECFSNDGRGFAKLKRWLQTHCLGSLRVGIESTNTYGHALARWLHQHGHRVYLLNPERTAHYAKAIGQGNKTDAADARSIAAFVAVHEGLTPWEPPTPEQEQLRALTRARHQLVAQALQLRSQLRTALPIAQAPLKAVLRTILAQIARIKTDLLRLLREQRHCETAVRRLQTIKGIGWLTAVTLIAELPTIGPQSDPRAICAWAGLVPRQRSSGNTHLPTHLSRKGNAHIRQALFMPAIVAQRYNPLFQAFAARLKAKGKRPGAVVGAVAHKLLRTAVGLLKSQSDFNPQWACSPS